MGGSGGTFGGRGRSPAEIASKLRKEAETSAAEFDLELDTELKRLLVRFNSRNSEETQERLAEVRAILHDRIDGYFDTMFGGSVAKHTFVDGISDVDSLLVVSGALADAHPDRVLSKVARALQKDLPSNIQVSTGSVAVTLRYPDGNEIQLVPCIKAGDKIRVPAWESNTWSTINPQQFRDGLTKRNEECQGKLIPTLKLAKAVNATLPPNAKLSGYHIESLGVAAFRDYQGERTPVRMLPEFFKRASELVLSPMRDRTGQSVHVDEHLGPAHSDARVVLSHTLARIHQRMLNASTAKSRERWLDLLGE